MTWIPEYPRFLTPDEEAPSRGLEVWVGTNAVAANALGDALNEASEALLADGVAVTKEKTIQPYSQIGLGSNLPQQSIDFLLRRIAEYLPPVHQGGEAPFTYVYQLPGGEPSFELPGQIESAASHVRAHAEPSA